MADIDERYQRGKIYTVRCRYDDNLIYVGSTIDKLAKRMAGHRIHEDCSLYQLVNGDWGNWYIELYEEYPCDNKEQLIKREGEVMREFATVNRRIAGRTIQEYYEDNRDYILEYKKKYYEDNRDEFRDKNKKYYNDNHDKILEKIKEKCKCDVCGVEITKKYLKKHQMTAKCINANKSV